MKKIPLFILIYLLFSCGSNTKNVFLNKDEKLANNHKKIIVSFCKDSFSIDAVPIKDSIFTTGYMLQLTNNKSKIIDQIRIEEGWLNNDESGYEKKYKLLNNPLINNLNISNNHYLTFKQRYHNGNICNGVFIHYIFYNTKEIKYIGSFEEKTILPMEDKFLIRTVDKSYKKAFVFKVNNAGDSLVNPIAEFNFIINKDTLIFNNLEIFSKKESENPYLIKNNCYGY